MSSPWDDDSKNKGSPGNKGNKTIIEFINLEKRGDGGNPFNFDPRISGGKIALLLLGVVVALWLMTGFYTVQPNQKGVVLRFGKYSRTDLKGLNYHLPYPFETVETVSVTRVSKEEIGYKSSSKGKRNSNSAEGQMLTSEETIIAIQFDVQWMIDDPVKYLFNYRDLQGENTVRSAAVSAMREGVSQSGGIEYINESREKVENEVKENLQQILDNYGTGIKVRGVQLQNVGGATPEVIDAYRDVQTSKAERENSINKAQVERNVIIPQARGEAAKIMQNAEAYKQTTVAKAQGEVSRFQKVYDAYRSDKEVTMKRMYIDTMESVFTDVNKMVLDSNASNSSIPLLSLNDLINKGK